MIFEYQRSARKQGVMVIVMGFVVTAVLCAFSIPFLKEEPVIVIVWMMLVLTIFLPLIAWDGVRHLRRGGEFRSWLSREKVGQVVPFGDYGRSFEVVVSEISALRRIDPVDDITHIRWVIEINDGKAFDLCDLYGNPVKRYFKLLAELRPDIEVLHEKR